MNVMLFLIISLVVHTVLVPYHPGGFEIRRMIRWLPTRLIYGTVVWAIICLIFVMTLPWAIISLIMSYALLTLVSAGFRQGHSLPEMFRSIRGPVVCISFLALLLVPVFSGVIAWTADVSNAQSVNEFIVSGEGELFENPIPDNQVRLVTNTLAEFVARREMSAIGSNVEIAAAHITTRNGRLVWVCVVVSTNVLAENYLQGLIVVDANDPDMVEIITDVNMPVGEGLFWDRNIQFGNYLQDMTSAYEYAYPTWDPTGELVYIQTRTQLGFDFVERPLGPIVYCENGTIVTYNTLEETPYWITQAYSEEWLERQINRWGAYRRGTGFDLFAGGFLWFIEASRNRVEMTEDTRYILNPDTGRVEALVTLHPPASTSLTLSGIMRGTRDGIYFYDKSNSSMISGEAAVNEVIKSFTQPVTGSYYGGMPLIYPVMINSTYSRQAWYCPIYWFDSTYDSDIEDYILSDFRLHALAIVDAEMGEISKVVEKGTKTSVQLVQQTREGYVQTAIDALGVAPEPQEELVLTATALNVTSYVDSGDTHIVLRTDNSSYEWIEGARDWMNITDWYTLLSIEVGDTFTAHLEQIGEQFRIVAFVKL